MFGQVTGFWGCSGGSHLSAFWAFRRFPRLGAYPAGHVPHPLPPRAQPAGQGAEETQSSLGWREALPGSPENPGGLRAGTESQHLPHRPSWLLPLLTATLRLPPLLFSPPFPHLLLRCFLPTVSVFQLLPFVSSSSLSQKESLDLEYSTESFRCWPLSMLCAGAYRGL